jgi:hypothetical protein
MFVSNNRDSMATLSVFNFISIDGSYKRLDEDISWHTMTKRKRNGLAIP